MTRLRSSVELLSSRLVRVASGSFSSRANLELVKDMANMDLGRDLTNVQPRSDLLIRKSVTEQLEDFPLSPREPLQRACAFRVPLYDL